jgi:Flagellar hook-length control protein FliK
MRPVIGSGPASFEPMEAIAVAAALLREQLPEVTLRPGASMLARVASRGEHHGVIVLAGIPLKAQLPADVQAGATLRLRVEDVSPERVTLRVDPGGAVAAPPPAPPGSVGQHPRVTVEDPPARRRGADGEPADVVSLAFHSPVLGRLDLRLELSGDRLLASVAAAVGRPHELAAGGADRLRESLERQGLNATVRVTVRRQPVDFYA